MNYYRFDVQTAVEYTEILIALLSVEEFEAFEETDSGFQAYLPEIANLEQAEQLLHNLQKRFPFSFDKQLQQQQNWNAIWESNFHPIRIDDFCGVRATFHEPMTEVQHEIVIQPKMSFGTGHHATTHMMIEMMEAIPMLGKSVWDFGSGTGILAILAAKMGAEKVVANDIDAWAYENAIENAQANDTPDIQVIHGVLEDVPRQVYDIILANITLNVISPALPTLYQQLRTGGHLVLSGFLESDIEALSAKAHALGLQSKHQRIQGEWACLHFVK